MVLNLDRLTIDQVDFAGKRVLMRVDFNVPLDDDRHITNDARIVAALPSIRYILAAKPRYLVLISHLGRPNGRVVPALSLRPAAVRLQELLKQPVTFCTDCVGEAVVRALNQSDPGAVVLLENLRFHAAETGKGIPADAPPGAKPVKVPDSEVAAFHAQLTALGDVYVSDAFGTTHRPHSSMVGIDLPVRAAGFLIRAELEAFRRVMASPARPYVAIVGGKKISDKIQLIENLLERVDELIIGGGISYTFLKEYYKVSIGTSLYDESGPILVPRIMEKARRLNKTIHLPIDIVVTETFDGDAAAMVARVDPNVPVFGPGGAELPLGIPDGWIGMDIGPKTREAFSAVIARAITVVWNGPVGVFEFEAFAQGTFTLLDVAAKRCRDAGAAVVIGGGDTATAVKEHGLTGALTHVSTGGGASIELLEGKVLPGIAFLSPALTKEP